MWRYTPYLLGALGFVGVLMGGLTVGLYTKLYDYIMKSQMELREGSMSYEMWEELPIPMYMKVYYFNCTNHEDVQNSGAKPLLKQVGPYTFMEKHFKENITFNDNNTVTFYQRKTWHFIEDESVSLDDEIYIINIIALSAAESTRWPNSFTEGDFPFLRIMMDASFAENNETFFTKVRVGNLTFEGIDSPLLHMGEGSPLEGAIQIPFDRFGWFYGRNGSSEYDGVFQMYTGVDDIQKVGQISQWQGRPTVDLYPSPCNQLSGSAGEFFPQHRDKTSISYFTPDLCRSIFFNFKDEVEVSGVPGYRYWLDKNFVGNSSVNASNACFNPHPDLLQTPLVKPGTPDLSKTVRPIDGSIDIGLVNGLLNVSACKFNSPSYVSFPHFYQADPALLSQFHPDSDLMPSEDKHASYLTLMPEQGIPLDVSIRLQINILVRPLEFIKIMENIPTMFYPMIWFETTTELTDDLVGQLKLLDKVPSFGDYIGYPSIGVGVLLCIVTAVLLFRRRTTYV